jgi:hypothetical protein
MDSVFPELEREMAKRGMDYRGLAKVAGTSDMQMYRRLRGISRWQLHEVLSISDFFSHTDINTLFARR